jgi:phage terminase small subunit
MELTGKHRLFAAAVLAGMSNKDAAIAAGYSEKSAGPAGSRLAKHAGVAAFIKKYKKAGAPPPPPAKTPSAPKFDIKAALMFSDPLLFLSAAMNDPAAAPKLRVEAAKAMLPFVHPRKGEAARRMHQPRRQEKLPINLPHQRRQV